MDDAVLIDRARKGDRGAFGILARRHFETAWAVALAVTGEPADAEDVCQDALVRAWRRLDGLRVPARFRSWLARVTRRVALNHVDARARRAGRCEPLAEYPAPGPSPLTRVLDGELRRILLDAAEELTELQRQVLLLYDLQGFSHREVAEALGISEVGSRRHLSDARRRMRGVLEALLPEPGGLA